MYVCDFCQIVCPSIYGIKNYSNTYWSCYRCTKDKFPKELKILQEEIRHYEADKLKKEYLSGPTIHVNEEAGPPEKDCDYEFNEDDEEDFGFLA